MAIILICGCLMAIIIVFITIKMDSEQDKREERMKRYLDGALNHLKRGDFKGASWYKDASSSDTSPLQVVAKIAEAMQNGSPQDIKQIITLSLIHKTIVPSLHEAYINYARNFFAKGDYHSAQIWYQVAYESNQNKALDCFNLGVCCLQLQDFSNAVHFFEKSLTYKDTFAAAYDLFLALTCSKQYNKALEIFQQLRARFSAQLAQKKKLLAEIPLEHLTEEL